ncbi:ROK family transcriptional regulator [Caulobacter segnis]|uniref:ROK family protein n=1 Tax=Caulobacter segnis TaxID=88688 RepID=A0A2W5WRN8_9CAUL|nr:ROK family transcriptional regulator [Caulobacter segnis]PZR30564.1 MAG: hypothetical protein DI526_22185 [Caulobacter segnis]
MNPAPSALAPSSRDGLFDLNATERRVLQVVRQQGEVHRGRIAELCGLQASTLTNVSTSLILRGLLVEVMASPSGKRGKPRQILSLAPEGAFAAGAALTVEHLEICLADLAGQPRWEARLPLWDLSPEAVAQEIARQLAEGRAALGWPDARFLGLGLAMPGHVGRGSPIPIPLPQFASWRGLHPGRFLAERLGVRVVYENDAASMALAESLFGDGRQFRSFLSIYVAHGVGGGLIMDGQLQRGAHGNAGEIGAFFPRNLARPSGDDLLAHLARWGFPVSRIEDVTLTEEIRPAIESWIERAADQLLEVVRSATYLLDPEAVFVCGLLPKPVAERLVERMRSAAAARVRDENPWPEIRLSSVTASGPRLGAAALPLTAALAPEPLSAIGF